MTQGSAMPVSIDAGAPADIYAEIARRLQSRTADQVVAAGERTGWWTADDVDWVYDGRPGPRPREDGHTPAGPSATAVRTCRHCGCTDDRACPGGCSWVSADVCSACRTDDATEDHAGRLSDALIEMADIDRELRDGPASALAGFATAQLLQEAAASTALDGETHVVGAADTAAAPSPPEPAGPYVSVVATVELFVDRTYQRPLDVARARRMAAAWDPRLVGILDVSDRGPDCSPRYAVVAGQHRWAAATRVTVTHLACNVHEGLDLAGEAALLAELDRTTKLLSGPDKWRARRGAGDQVVLDVERIAAAHGLRVEPQLADGVLRAYGAAEKLLQQGGERLLDSTLAVLRGAYGMAAPAWQAPLVSGVGQLLRAHPDVDVDRLTRALADTTPTQLRSTATMLRDVEPGTLAQLMVRAIAGAYNRTPGRGGRIAGGRS